MTYCFSMTVWPALWIAVLAGLIFGSFLNVCIARLPGHESIVTPRSRCPVCRSPIWALDNIPVASWLWLRGRCRACHGRISVQYPLVELGTAFLFAACVFQTGLSWQTLIDAVACFFLLGLAVMDAQTMLLPDSFTLTGIALALALRVGAPGIHDRAAVASRTIAEAGLAAAMLLIVLAVYWIVRRKQGVGWGDVKLLAMIAAFLGLPLTLFTYFTGVVAAAVFAAFLVFRHKARGFDRLPFGSFLAGAAIVAIFAGRPMIAWYLSFFR